MFVYSVGFPQLQRNGWHRANSDTTTWPSRDHSPKCWSQTWTKFHVRKWNYTQERNRHRNLSTHLVLLSAASPPLPTTMVTILGIAVSAVVIPTPPLTIPDDTTTISRGPNWLEPAMTDLGCGAEMAWSTELLADWERRETAMVSESEESTFSSLISLVVKSRWARISGASMVGIWKQRGSSQVLHSTNRKAVVHKEFKNQNPKMGSIQQTAK